jgi:UDP-glucose 4-epimerase
MTSYLVTGGAGFIGSNLIDALLARGDSVIALDDLSQGCVDNVEQASTNPRFLLVEGDVRDHELLDELVRECEIVVHLAARIGLKLVVASALKTLEANVDGTQTVLNTASRYRRRTLVASTSEVYGLTAKIPSSENDPICFGSPTRARWSYAASKALDEFLALALHREQGLPATVVRLFNTVGPRQTGRYGMVIPRFVSQALANEPLTVYGDGSQTRCFCSVDDVVWGLLTLLDDDTSVGDVFNLGNPHEIAIIDLAKRVIDLVGSTSAIRHVPFEEAYESGFEEIVRRVPDISKIQQAIGFTPKVTLDSILRSVIESSRKAPVTV